MVHQNIFPEKLGHFVFVDDDANTKISVNANRMENGNEQKNRIFGRALS